MATYHMLQEALTTSPRLKGLTESMGRQERGHERLVVELKTTIHRQRDIPDQILFDPPVVLRFPKGQMFRIPLEFEYAFLCTLRPHLRTLRKDFGALGAFKRSVRPGGMLVFRNPTNGHMLNMCQPWDALFRVCASFPRSR